jgi:glutathione S-transferase
MIKLYHAPHTRSVRVRWLLEELKLPYELIAVEFSPAVLRSETHRKLHPLGQLPVIDDDGLLLFESGAIMQHIMERYGDHGLLPLLHSAQRSRCWQWFHFGESSLARYASDIVRARFAKPEGKEFEGALNEARKRWRECLQVLENALGDGPYLLGKDFSAADIMVGYGLMLGRLLQELPDEYTRCLAYLQRLRERPAYQKAIA